MGSSLFLKGGANTPKSVVETFSISHSFSVGDVVRFDTAAGQWVKSQANTAENSEVVGVVSASSAGQFDVTYAGYISIPTITNNYPVLFLDSAVAGGLTASPPSAIGTVVKPVLTKSTSGSGYVVTNYLGTQIGGSSTVSIDEIQPVGTIMPFAGSVIPDSWIECNGNSYAVGTYPQLYAKLQNSSGDRVPAYGYVATLFGTNVSSALAAGDYIQYKAAADAFTGTGSPFAGAATNASLLALVLSVTSTSAVVQVIPAYSSTTKNFTISNTVFASGGFVGSETGTGNYRAYSTSSAFKAVSLTITSAAITHFNTPDLRGRFALGVNAPNGIGELETDSFISAISGIYSLGSEGGQEFVAAPGFKAALNSGGSVNAVANFTNDTIANMPPYTVVRYIIKATPYTRAAIIDGLDLPYPNLLVSDLRDGTLRPGGSGEDLLFKTNTGSSGVERMRLSNDGRLGIGMSPAISGQMLSASKDGNENTRISVYNANNGNAAIASLHLNNNVTNGYVALYGNGASSHANMTSLENGSNGGGLLLYSGSPNGPIQFKVGSGVERMRLSKEGYLGIGSGGVSPLAALDVNGNGNQIWIRPGPGGAIAGATAGLKLEYTPWNEGLLQSIDYTGTSTVKKLALNPLGGGVGVGLTAPTDNFSLHVKQASTGAIAFGSQTVYGVLGIDGSSNMVLNAWSGHVFQMGGSEKVRFASDGKVGIGTNSPQQLFVVSAGGTSGIECVPGFQANLSIIQAYNRGTATYDTLDLRGSDFKFRIGTTEKIGINSTGDVNILSTTNSTTKTTGALKVAGGLGVSGAIYAGGLEANTVTASDATASNSTTTGSLIVKGGAGIAGTVNAAGVSAGTGTFNSLTATNFSLTNALAVTSLSSGNITSSGTIEFQNLTDATSSSSAAVKVSGGVGIAKKLFVGSTDASTSISSGALVVSGGAGIAGALNVGATASFGGNVGIGANASVDRLTINSNTTGYTGGILNSNTQSGSYLRTIPLGTNVGVNGWTNSSIVFEGVPASSGNTIIGSFHNDLVFQTNQRANRMRINSGGALIHNGTTSGAVGALSFVPSSVNPIYNRIVFGGDNTGYGLAIASQHVTTNVVTDRLVLYDNDNINIPGTRASTSTNTGALTVGGGVGVAGALYVGARATANVITTANGISFGTGGASMPVPAGDAPMFAVRAWGVARDGGAAQPYYGSFVGGNLSYSLDLYNSVYWHVFTFDTAMPDTNYSVVVTCQRSSGTGIGSGSNASRNDTMSWAIKVKETTRFAVVTRVDSSTSFENMESINVMVIR